ncbi:MAG: lipid-A-disaccharide synthase [Synergistaceae bacterium]|nr:lipid-A-disaccharide synthase [Synergistaceae bacterium]
MTGERSIFISAGEVSGDHYTARAASLIRKHGFAGRIYGMCGAESRAEGIETLWNNEALHLMGFSEVLRSIGSVMRLMKDMRRNILETDPDAMIVADSPDFHLPLIRYVRKNGYKGRIFYISPPSVWAWRKGRVKTIRRSVDVSFPLFGFEDDYLRSEGCDTRWIGHPLAEEFINFTADRGNVSKNISGPAAEGSVIAALLPGSRRTEIEPLYPVLSGLYKRLESRGVSPVFSVAPGLGGRARDFLIKKLTSANERFYEGPGRNIMGMADIVVGASGTATAEALLLRRFMIVLYKVRPMSYVIGRMLLRGVKFAIPNILAGDYFYPELLQGEATAENALKAVARWLDMDESKRDGAIRKMDRLAGMMGNPGVYDYWAREILEVLQ